MSGWWFGLILLGACAADPDPGAAQVDAAAGEAPPDDWPDEPPEGFDCLIDAYCPFNAYCAGNERVYCAQVGCSEGYDACSEPCSGTNWVDAGELCEICVPDRLVNDGELFPGSLHQPDAARCIGEAEACGGPEARPCPAGSVCRSLPHLGVNGCGHLARGGYGWCEPVLDCDDGQVPPEAVCGCDGAAYPSACAAAAAGVAVEPARRGDWEGLARLVPTSVCEARAAAAGDPTADGAFQACTPPADDPTACIPAPECAVDQDCACDHACVDGACAPKADPLACDPAGVCRPSCRGVALTGRCLPPEAGAPPGRPGRCEPAAE